MMKPELITLVQAKDWLRSRLKEGEKCPCCNQHAKIYSRRLYSSMAASLVVLYKIASNGRWVHKRELVKHPTLGGTFGGGDFAKLSYWELIEENPKDDSEDKRTSGWWRITETGKHFVEGSVSVKSHVHLYDGKVLGFEGYTMKIYEALGTKFSYEELRNGGIFI